MGIRSTLAGYLFSKHSIYMYRERESTFARWYGRFARNVMDYTIRNYHFVDCSRWFDLSFTRSIFFPLPYLRCDWLNRSIRLDNIFFYIDRKYPPIILYAKQTYFIKDLKEGLNWEKEEEKSPFWPLQMKIPREMLLAVRVTHIRIALWPPCNIDSILSVLLKLRGDSIPTPSINGRRK